MCGRNIVANTYYHGGTTVESAANIDKTARTMREMAQAQHDSYGALAENLAAAQRRSMGLAEGGLKFVRMQEDNTKAAQEFFAGSVRLLGLQGRNDEFMQQWTDDAVEVVREQTEHNARTAEAFARAIGRQQEGFRALGQVWTGAYGDLFSPLAYAREGMRTFQQAARQGLEATEQVARQGLRAAEEATERTDKVLRQTEEATRQAELRTAVFGALGTTDYDALTVEEVSRRIEGLPADQLRKVREYEKDNKDRETLVGQIDRKIRANNA